MPAAPRNFRPHQLNPGYFALSNLIVREVRPADFAAWSPLWDGYNAFGGRSGPTALAPEITAETWRRFFDPAEQVYGLLAERDGQVLGLAHYLFHRSTI